MAGLARICKAYGGIRVNGVLWTWDYARDMAVKDAELTVEQRGASERARYEQLRIPDPNRQEAP